MLINPRQHGDKSPLGHRAHMENDLTKRYSHSKFKEPMNDMTIKINQLTTQSLWLGHKN